MNFIKRSICRLFTFLLAICSIIYSVFFAILSKYGVLPSILWFIFVTGIIRQFYITTCFPYFFNADFYQLLFWSFLTTAVMLITPFLFTFWYNYKFNLKVIYIVPLTLTSLILTNLIICKNNLVLDMNVTDCYELHLKPTCSLKKIAKKNGKTFDSLFLAEIIEDDIYKLNSQLGDNTVYAGITKLSIPGLIRKVGLTENVVFHNKCRLSNKFKTSRLFIMSFKGSN